MRMFYTYTLWKKRSTLFCIYHAESVWIDLYFSCLSNVIWQIQSFPAMSLIKKHHTKNMFFSNYWQTQELLVF